MPEKRDKIYFASDMHLGMHPLEKSRLREKTIVKWLGTIEEDASELWLLGDIFDYWFEHKKVVPRGYIRFLGKLAELADNGIKIHIFPGNHDVWYFNYFQEEMNAVIHHEPEVIQFADKTFYLAHGDGLTNRDKMYLAIKKIFKNRFLQWMYARIHPNGSAAFAQWWSKKSRYSKDMVHPFKGADKEEQVLFAKEKLAVEPDIDYFLFGHRHMPYDVKIGKDTRAICLGEWIVSNSYGVFDGKEFKLEKYIY